MKTLFASLSIFLLAITTSCGPGQIFGPTLTLTPTITPSPTATLTPTATATPTLTPTPTPTPLGGGSGQFVFGAHYCEAIGDCSDSYAIYTYNLKSHETKLLFEGYPLRGVSPDGSKLLLGQPYKMYQEKYELYISRLDGTEKILLHKTATTAPPKWLPGTDKIVFVAYEGSKPQVFIINSDGTGLTQVTHSTVGILEILRILEKGVYVEEGYHTPGSIYSQGYSWVSFDGSEIQKMDNWLHPAFSTDENYVAYIYMPTVIESGATCMIGCSIIISKLDGSEPTTIALDQVNLPSETHNAFRNVTWVPNEKKIIAEVFVCNPQCESRYFLFAEDGKLLKELSSDIVWIPNISGMSFWPCSPDGRLLIINDYEQTDSGYIPIKKLVEIETEQASVIDFGLDPEWRVYEVLWLQSTQ